MSGQLTYVKNKGVVTISISGMFDARLVSPFRAILDEIDSSDKQIIIDMKDAEYLDSAALGLLIHLKKKFSELIANQIKIIHCNDRVSKVFRTMRFEQLFDIQR